MPTRNFKLTSIFVVMSIALLTASVASAEPIRIQPSQPIKSRFNYNFAHRHDFGFVTTVDLGLGYGAIYSPTSKGAKQSNDRIKIADGAVLLFLLSGGWTLVPSLSIEVSTFGMVGPENGNLAFGPLARYWFDESGWSVAVSMGPSTFKASSLNQDYFSNLSMAMQCNVALSLWLSDHTHGSVKLVAGVSGLNLYHSGNLSSWWVGGAISFGVN